MTCSDGFEDGDAGLIDSRSGDSRSVDSRVRPARYLCHGVASTGTSASCDELKDILDEPEVAMCAGADLREGGLGVSAAGSRRGTRDSEEGSSSGYAPLVCCSAREDALWSTLSSVPGLLKDDDVSRRV